MINRIGLLIDLVPFLGGYYYQEKSEKVLGFRWNSRRKKKPFYSGGIGIVFLEWKDQRRGRNQCY